MLFDESHERLIEGVNHITVESGLDQEDFVLEECAEFAKEVTKMRRHKGSITHVLEEANDILAALMVLFYRYDVQWSELEAYCAMKWQRAIDRYNDHGET